MDTHGKLQLLAEASQYDLACACNSKDSDRRTRTPEGVWLYPVSLPSGGNSVLLKTLMSNVCSNDCKYCPLRNNRDERRCSLEPDEVARVFMDYHRRGKVFGLFLSSGVVRDPDHTMQRLADTARILRSKHRFRGYMHLKVIPGASDAALQEVISLSSAVSINVEVPTAEAMGRLSSRKDFHKDIVSTVRKISEWTAPGSPFSKVKQTTQFIVGAAGESDTQIVKATFGLYRRLRLSRVFFSAYQRGLGEPDLPGEQHIPENPGDVLTREHRLYQTDFLLRKYGFEDREIPFGADGNLSLEADPKELWARSHPELFPLDVNRADKLQLLRVPGLGPISVNRILKIRRNGGKVRRMAQVGQPGKRLDKAASFLKFGY